LNFSQNLKILREARDVNQVLVSRELGFSQQAVSLWEKGDREPNLTVLCTLADYFGVTTDQLLGRAPLPDENIGKEEKGVTKGNHEQRYSMKHYMCSCGKSEHYADALYCANCGKKIEEAVSSTPSAENHL
jgi:transcriptional regulator with XRE-family HTH domain